MHLLETLPQQAMNALKGAKPVLALIFADIAWKMQLQAQPGTEIGAIQEVIGDEIPIIGGYTFGQLVSTPDGDPRPPEPAYPGDINRKPR